MAPKQKRAGEIDALMGGADFWSNQERAQALIGELKGLNAVLKPLEELDAGLADVDVMLEMAAEDATFAEEAAGAIEGLETKLADVELKSLLSGENDGRPAILTIHARDGGVDANDWAEMLLRMYLQWAAKQGYDTELLDRQDNLEAGITYASIAVRGPMAYGYLKGETGMHRLVRISPFNSEGKRQTSFAAVDVTPEMEEAGEVEILPDDIREDTYTSSGPGGQHVNKTASAVRLTHLPTGLVVACQSERSQHKNRATAYKMLRAKLARLEEEKREAQLAEKYQSQAKTGFGSQIRNYFQHPDQRIKDARTGFAATNFQQVMDGNIQGFLDSVLRWRAGREGPAE